MIAVIIPAAGSGSRLGGLPKQLRHLGNAPLLLQTALVFDRHPDISCFVVVGPPDALDTVKEILIPLDKPYQVVPGGATRQDSVRAGLDVLDESIEVVLIHDAARPFISGEVITDVIDSTKAYGAAAAALPITDTVRYGKDGCFTTTISRENLYAMQTPQGFRHEILRKAFRQAEDVSKSTDDVELVYPIGQTVQIVHGERTNIKITTQSDWDWASKVWKKEGE
ncbi:MAG: 2-C-methyl-D-erythritol 4-phosphate cytidylyltransferase [Bacteroidetes bacterium]|nr:2-C-methyl-D-erythritol 4-phosphate cytidylyltransferase [Bacteroidota bacterium]